MDKETYTFEDRMYVNPTTSRDEQLQFVDNLRAIQAEDAARIARDTHNLGTDVTSNLGGLNGAEGVWSQQYVSPQVNSMVASLRSAAQAQALNDVLSNYQNQMQNRYKQAYRAAQKRKNNNGGGTGGTTGGGSGDGKVTFKPAEGIEVGSKEFAGSGAPVKEGDEGTASNITEEQLKKIQEWARLYQNINYPGIYGGF